MGGNLPRELTSFVGRQAQLADLAKMLQTAPLLTLVGVGGIGKTRLAVRVAASARTRYAHGVWFVGLAPIVDPAGVSLEVARALGIRERPGWTPLETLRAVLRDRQTLLIFDNCEHVVAACAELAADLLQTCSDLCILATSREALDVAGEVIYRVPPLPVDGDDTSVEPSPRGDAIELLVDRVRASDPGFELTRALGGSAARICRLLDGLPLAIELAAARSKTMSLGEIARGLHSPFSLLTLGPRSAPSRQRTLHAAIDWSYQLLTESEKTLLRRLAIFRGGCTREAAARVGADADLAETQIDDLLHRLVAQSLLIGTAHGGSTRFVLLETVRQYCWRCLEQAGEVASVRERHRDWCLDLVAGVTPEALGADDVTRLDPEMDNLRAALGWALGTEQVEAAARLALGLGASWFFHGSFSEARAWLTAVFELASGGSALSERSLAGSWGGTMAFNQGDYAAAQDLLQRALELGRASGSEYAVTVAESRLAKLAFQRGDLAGAKILLDRALGALDKSGSPGPLAALVRWDLGFTYLELGDVARAAEFFQAVRSGATPEQLRFASGRLLHAQAHLAERVGDHAVAALLLAEAVDAQRAVGDQPGVIESLTLQGAVAVESGDRKLAASVLLEALDLSLLFGSRMRFTHLCESLASVLVALHPETCIRLAAAAEHLRATLGAVPLPSERARLAPYVAAARQHLGQRTYGAVWAAALSAPLEATLTEARGLIQALVGDRVSEARTDAAPKGELSPREREVATLVTRGLSNREISAELVVSGKTAEAHINHILNKLGFSNRVQIATWGMRHGLVVSPEGATAGSDRLLA